MLALWEIFSQCQWGFCSLPLALWIHEAPVLFSRLPVHDGWVVLWVRLRSGGGQEACPWRGASCTRAGTHCPASLGPHGCFGQVMLPPAFPLPSPRYPSETTYTPVSQINTSPSHPFKTVTKPTKSSYISTILLQISEISPSPIILHGNPQ